MERNDDLMNSSTGGTSGLGGAGTSGFGAAGSTGGTGGYGAGSAGGASDASTFGSGSSTLADDASASTSRFQSARDAATDKLGQLKDKAANLHLREKASNLNASLADKLEAGANKLRQSGQGTTGGELAGTAGAGTVGATNNAQLANISNKAADALQGTARFLREGDIKASVEQQVRTNPARTLLVALGVGYVLGKAFRGGNRS